MTCSQLQIGAEERSDSFKLICFQVAAAWQGQLVAFVYLLVWHGQLVTESEHSLKKGML